MAAKGKWAIIFDDKKIIKNYDEGADVGIGYKILDDDAFWNDAKLINEHGKKYVTPRQRGTIVLFDSRANHCVTKVRSGVRKSIVGWVVGPHWR